MASIKWRGREVKNPFLRAIILIVGIASIIVGILWAVFVFVAIIVTSPVWIPIHLLLRAFGKRGFYYVRNGTHTVEFSTKAFK